MGSLSECHEGKRHNRAAETVMQSEFDVRVMFGYGPPYAIWLPSEMKVKQTWRQGRRDFEFAGVTFEDDS
jgi:hypothetical protein